jgi:2-keto-3-deoxy-L-fuconate dehydrogenase
MLKQKNKISMLSLKGKVAIVTGGGSGIGRAISLLFASRGAKVIILDIDKKGSEETVHAIFEQGGQAVFKRCSIAVEEEVNAVFHSVILELGQLDIVVNNAGISHIGNVESTMAVDFDRVFSVNVKGVYHVIKAAIPHLKKKGGVVLNMSSVAALVGLPDRFAYSMTKGAVSAITLSIAKDYLAHKIRCNSISPARVHTPFVDGFLSKNYPGNEEEMFKKLSATQPIGRMAKPEEIAYLALYLCSDEAAFITGCDYPIDGGFTRLNN